MRGEIDRAAPTVMPADPCGSSGQKVVPNDLFSSPSLNKIDGIGGLTGFTVRLTGHGSRIRLFAIQMDRSPRRITCSLKCAMLRS